jgi:hypothetical protein
MLHALLGAPKPESIAILSFVALAGSRDIRLSSVSVVRGA